MKNWPYWILVEFNYQECYKLFTHETWQTIQTFCRALKNKYLLFIIFKQLPNYFTLKVENVDAGSEVLFQTCHSSNRTNTELKITLKLRPCSNPK